MWNKKKGNVCPNCGKELKPEARFCTGCGASVETVASVETPAEAEKRIPVVQELSEETTVINVSKVDGNISNPFLLSGKNHCEEIVHPVLKKLEKKKMKFRDHFSSQEESEHLCKEQEEAERIRLEEAVRFAKEKKQAEEELERIRKEAETLAAQRREMEEQFTTERSRMEEQFAAERSRMEERFTAEKNQLNEQLAAEKVRMEERLAATQSQAEAKVEEARNSAVEQEREYQKQLEEERIRRLDVENQLKRSVEVMQSIGEEERRRESERLTAQENQVQTRENTAPASRIPRRSFISHTYVESGKGFRTSKVEKLANSKKEK